MQTRVPGRLLAWTALLVALAASIGANVAQAQPAAGPRATAAVAPLLVILASGLLERVELVGARWWQRLLIIGGLLTVVTAAFVTSFQHQYELLVRYGNEPLSAALLPLAVDALIIMASVCLAVIAERRRSLLAQALVGELEPEPQDDEPEPDAEAADTASDTGEQSEQRKRTRRQLTTAERVERLYKADPRIGPSAIAKRLDISERTAQRHLQVFREADVDAMILEKDPEAGARVVTAINGSGV